MAAFSSARERALWLWAAGVVVAIFSTIGLARTLADELRNRRFFDIVFFWAFVAIIVAVALLVFRVRLGRAELGVVLAVAAVYLMVFLRMAIPEERTHLVEYGVVAILVFAALTERREQGRPVWRPAVLAIVVTSAVGIADECVQGILPSRVFDVRDIGFNVLAAFLAVGASAALTSVRQRGERAAGQ